jgi:hypothetical protein
MSDAQDDGRVLPATANQAFALNPNFGIFIGDLESGGVTKTMMNEETSALGNLYPELLFVRGNHDDEVHGSAGLWENYFAAANRPLPAGVTNLTGLDSKSIYLNYSFDYGNSRFIGLDVPGDADLLTSSELTFLDNRLANAENIGLAHAFIFFHGPPYCAESSHCNCSAKSDASCTPPALISVINKHLIVAAIFDGHEHLLAWTHMDNSRIANLTHPYEQFLTSPSATENYNRDLYPNRVDYANLKNAMAFGSITVNGSSFTVKFYRVGTTTPVWSKTFIHTGIPAVPGKPILTSLTMLPQNGALVTNLTPTIDWGAPRPAAANYRIQVSTSNAFTSIAIDQTNISTNSYTLTSTLAPGLRYYWRVQGINTAGVAGAWAFTHYFQTPLGTTILLSPATGKQLSTDRPIFAWQDVTGATFYNFQIASDSNFRRIVAYKIVIPSTFTPTSDLPRNTLLYWRVMAKTAFVSSFWSEVRSFTSGNPPSIPILSKPPNKAISSSYTPLFDWSNSTVPVGATFDHYQIQIASDMLFTSPLIDANVPGMLNSTFTPSTDLPSNTIFYWHVRSFSTAGHYSAWSSVYYFRTTIPPAALTLPKEGSTVTSLRPTLDWSDVAGASSYMVQVSRSSTFSSIVLNKVVTASEFTPTSDLPQNTLLYWRVMTKTAFVSSIWSDVHTFTSANPPSIPILSRPANKSISSSYTPVFDWSNSLVPAGVTFDHYQIQVSSDMLFTAPVIDSNIPGVLNSTFTPSTDLPSSALFYWRVRSFSSDGHYSAWSCVFYFRTTIAKPGGTALIGE